MAAACADEAWQAEERERKIKRSQEEAAMKRRREQVRRSADDGVDSDVGVMWLAWQVSRQMSQQMSDRTNLNADISDERVRSALHTDTSRRVNEATVGGGEQKEARCSATNCTREAETAAPGEAVMAKG